MAGLSATGFAAKTLQEILADIVARQKASAEIGPSHDYSDASALGQLNGTIANGIAEVWELAAAVYSSADPEAAVGTALTALAALTGTLRREAVATRVLCTVNLDPGTELLPGEAFASVTDRPDLQFILDPDGASVANAGGTAADFEAYFVCTVTGPVVVNAGTLEVIDTAVSGWNSITNEADGETGRAADTDLIVRERRVAQIALAGSGTVRAIRAALLDVSTHPEFDTIEAVLVLENTGDVTDANGLPPHSIEAIIDDGPTPSVDDGVIAQAIFDEKCAGITAHGALSGEAEDAYGLPVIVGFTRVTRQPVYLDVTLTTNTAFPANGIEQVKAALAARGATLNVEEDVIALFLRAACFEVPGVVDVPVFELGFTVDPSGTANLEVGYRSRATFDTANMVVNGV